MRKVTKSLALAAVVAGSAIGMSANAAVLLEWDIPSPSAGTSLAATSGTTGFTGTLALGPAYSPTDFNSYDLSGYATQDTADLADAKAKNMYFSWTIAPAAGDSMTLDSIGFLKVISQNQGRTFYLTSSQDNFATAIDTYVSPDTQTFAGPTVNLSGFTNLTQQVEFRWYVQGKGAYEAVGFGDNVTGPSLNINGSTGVPEPTALSLLGVAGLLGLRRRRA